MKYYRLDNDDKLNNLNRCFSDVEHGCATLALERLGALHLEFPRDPQVTYAEGLIRKDFLGQGLQAQECFLRAQGQATVRSRSNENYLFTTFNSAKYARNLQEYLRQESTARALAPDDPDLRLFEQINKGLAAGEEYPEILGQAASNFQEHARHGDCAAFAELALSAGESSLQNQIDLRRARMQALRELDKAAELSRGARGESFAPGERLTLIEAMREMDAVLALDPHDHMHWNLKSAWLLLLNEPERAIEAADHALSLCPDAYLKPRTNKAVALRAVGRRDESRMLAAEVVRLAEAQGIEGQADGEVAKRILHDLDAAQTTDDELLGAIAERVARATQLATREETELQPSLNLTAEFDRGMSRRISAVGQGWSDGYVRMMAEILVYFSPQTAWNGLTRIRDRHPRAFRHCVHAALYLAASCDGVMRRDACRFLIVFLLGAMEPDKIRRFYREAILGSAAVGPGAFSKLAQHMREELERFNVSLVRLLCDQPPLTSSELEWARRVTMARFIEGVSRDPVSGPEQRPGLLAWLRRLFQPGD